ncbi:hypothetical protein F5144DRAFT_654050 [Chaetomium tenue]|uniref:Uncharacterized protein n=2 Tax=Chaetomium tenue TaxID=1854479 RepID=A0ACB7NW57_9PEZI|nr:hypothetical protein F5144DRAFT_661781 [Chaetomium globosum]KAH6628090.1 hypothetical protein F5144DRAFT_654050 [Chaetomium globosum]
MPRALQYRTKLAIIRRRLQRRVDKRQRERSESPNQPGNDTPSQRPRHADPVEVDDDAVFADIPSGSGDFDQGSDFGDDWEPQAVTDFDENELAHALVDAAIEEDHVVYPDPDPDTGEYQVADDAPLQSELRALAEYQYIADTVEDQDDEADATDAEDVADEIAVATPWQAYHQYGEDMTDPFAASESIKQPRKIHGLSDFALGWGLYCIVNGVSRKQYATQLELFKLLGRDADKVNRLPDSLDTLKRHVRESLPHIDMRTVKDLPLNPKKLSSSRQVTAMTTGENPTHDLFFLNPVDFLSRIEGSQLAKGMHYGLADLVDSPIEAWHSMQWAGSVRTTSGVFVWYPPLPASPKDPIFPGDIVDFECTFRDCRHCHSADDTSKPHVGQVMAVYRDRRDSTRDLGLIAASNNNVDQAQQGDVVLVIARVLRGHVIKNIVANQAIEIKTNPARDNVTDNEWVLSYSPMELVPSAKIRGRRTDIGFDYAFGSQVEFDDDPRERIGMPLIRRIFMKEQCAFMPPCLVPPVPGALEVIQFGREVLINKFAIGPEQGQVRSLPCLDFNDGFGLYRTMTKSIMGCYLQIAAMPRSEHTRQINVLPVTLGPHGANFDDVMKALAPLKALDQGITVVINGVETLLCAPIIAFTGDMPQQQDNSGCLSVAANLGCRNCRIPVEKRDKLDFNILDQTRAHVEMLRLRRAMDDLPQKYRKQAFSTKHGISLDRPAVQQVAPALDLISGRPGDAAHSEFNGITKMTHQILIDAALKPDAVVAYSKILRQMPFPPGWARIQSPYNVLNYSLQEHARWSVLMTIISLLWLTEADLKRPFVQAVRGVFSQTELTRGQATDTDVAIASKVEHKSAVEVLTLVLAAIVKTNEILSAPELDANDRDPATIMDTIRISRRMFQLICEAASRSTNLATGAAAAAAAAAARRHGSLASSRAGSVAPSAPRPAAGNTIEPVIEEDEEAVDDDINIGQLTVAQKASKYRQWAQRPNVHVGLHYVDVFRRYGLVSLMMVLPGELKHKLWKNIVLTMNHRNPEKDCLAYENMLQTVRLTLLDGFRYDDPDITTDIKNLASAAPSLFSSLLPREGLQDDDDDSSIWDIIVGDDLHPNASVLVLVKARVYQDMGFPVREGALVPTFLWMLRDAYRVDYDKNIIVTTNWHIRWWKKVSFGDGPISTKPKGVQRLVYQRGQFVKYRDGNVGRLEHIMTHEAVHGSGQFFVFLVITPLADTGSTEPLTGLPILKMAASGANIAMAASLEDCRHRLIGLPALRRDRLYMVPFTTGPGRRLLTGIGNTELEADTELLWVNWRVQFT